jgi:hypothetical protein
MTTIAQHRENTKEALKMISTVIEAETGITYRRLIQAAERITGQKSWNATDMTFVDFNLGDIMPDLYHDIRQRFSPNLHKTDYRNIVENPLWNEEIYNRGLESGWALIDYYMAKKAKKQIKE